ncbi:hypothetical protein KM043_002897 [Ampulex compressa]|nr:hypothetical protein KM043_002897 [Ampulex compressa]
MVLPHTLLPPLVWMFIAGAGQGTTTLSGLPCSVDVIFYGNENYEALRSVVSETILEQDSVWSRHLLHILGVT